jgi:hypothetical protein
MNKLNPIGLGLSLGVVWAFCTLLTGWTAMIGWGKAFVKVMSSIYIGYQASFMGAIIGAVWAFIDLCIAGIVVAFLYNHFSGVSKKR